MEILEEQKALANLGKVDKSEWDTHIDIVAFRVEKRAT